MKNEIKVQGYSYSNIGDGLIGIFRLFGHDRKKIIRPEFLCTAPSMTQAEEIVRALEAYQEPAMATKGDTDVTEYMTSEEAATYLRMKVKTLWNKKASGQIPDYCMRKVGGSRLLFVRAGLEKWVSQGGAA